MDTLSQDLRQSLRTLRRDVGFSATVVFTLALGVGVNTAVFGAVRSVLLEPLPYDDPDRLAMVWTTIDAQGVDASPSSYANVQDWKAQTRVFEDLATFDPTSLTLTGGDWAEQMSAAKVSANLFSVLGVPPAVGRTFSPDEERQRAPVVVLSHELWRRQFSTALDPLGQAIEIGGSSFQVIGVMPDGFAFPGRDTRLWLPQTLFTDWDATVARRGTDAWRVVGRLRSGASLEDARRDMNAIAGRLEQAYPSANAGLGIRVLTLHDQVTGHSFRLALWMLFGAVVLVLLIACVNVTHLLLVRGLDRAPEFALRVALGATTPRLLRQALIESTMLSLVAGIAGVLLAMAALPLLVRLAPVNIPRLDEISVAPTVLIYGILVSLAAGVLAGIASALSHSRGALHDTLREHRGPSQRTPGHRARKLLITSQFALAIILVFGANLLIRSLIQARRVDPGFQPEKVLMASLSVESSSRRGSFYEQVAQEVRAIPGARTVGLVEDLFISGAPNRAITIEGSASAAPSFAEMRIDAIGGDLFQTIGVPLRAGRAFSESDGADAPPVAIINQTMAQRFWPGEVAVGKRFRTGSQQPGSPWIEVVGVVGDMHRQGPEKPPIPQAFRPYAQQPSRNMILLVRTDQLPLNLAAAVRARITAIDRTVPLYSVTTVERALDRYLLQRRFETLLLGLFSAIALILAAVGIYGLIQYSVAQRTREIGVRIALGAVSAQVVTMILRQGLSVAIPGLAVGVTCALWLSEAISALLFGVAPSDLPTLVVTSSILLLTTLVACYIPARRAARIDPTIALRYR
jgi:putative ABC transport system permease protein